MAVPQHLFTQAQKVFNTIMNQSETSPFNAPPGQSSGTSYKPLTLLKCAYEQVEFKDRFLGYMFRSIHDLEGLTSPQGPDFDIARVLEEYHPEFNNYEETLSKIGENFYKTFVITLKAGGKTPYSSITTSPDLSGESMEAASSAPRDASVGKQCRERDGYRCVISNMHDVKEGTQRFKDAQAKGIAPKDVDGESLSSDVGFEHLDVAHIIPWSLGDLSGPNKEAKTITRGILQMFGSTIETIIRQEEIDTPGNTMLLNKGLHYYFRDFGIYFEHLEGNQYEVKSWNEFIKPKILPRKVTLRQHGSSTTTLPLQGLLKTHKAIGEILHVSGAAEAVDRLLRELDEETIDAGGSTSLGDLVGLQLSRTGNI